MLPSFHFSPSSPFYAANLNFYRQQKCHKDATTQMAKIRHLDPRLWFRATPMQHPVPVVPLVTPVLLMGSASALSSFSTEEDAQTRRGLQHLAAVIARKTASFPQVFFLARPTPSTGHQTNQTALSRCPELPSADNPLRECMDKLRCINLYGPVALHLLR